MSKEDEDETAKKTSVKNVAKPTSATSKAAGKAAKAKAEETVSEEKSSPGVKTEKETKKRPAEESEEPAPAPKAKRSRCKKAMAAAKAASVAETKEEPSEDKKADISTIIRPSSSSDSTESGERNYWLMKAEPETRLENGVDVKFSIDDLAARTEPEPWDGKEPNFFFFLVHFKVSTYILTCKIRHPQLRRPQQPPRHEKGRSCFLLPLQLQGTRHRWYNGNCARALARL